MKYLLFLTFFVLTLFVNAQDKMGFGNDPEGADSAGFGTVTTWVKPMLSGCVMIGSHCYDTVRIGSQTWLAENLQFDDGSSGIYYPDSSVANLAEYGRLYDYYAAIRVDADIEGWHLPTLSEYQTLLNEVGYYNEFDEGWDSAGVHLKDTGTDHWDDPNYADNNSGFSEVGAGGYDYFDGGSYYNFRSFCYLTCATQFDENNNYIIVLFNEYDQVELWPALKTGAYSVRLIKD